MEFYIRGEREMGTKKKKAPFSSLILLIIEGKGRGGGKVIPSIR